MMDIEHQLKSTLELLESVKWLYDFPVTQLFSSGVLDLIPSEWKEVLSSLSLDELNGLPQCQAKEHWPKSLQHFLSQCKVLSLFEFITLQNEPMVQKIENLPEVPLPGELLKGMSAKKKHEVCRLTALVKASAPQCQHVLDFGSGKGYIDTALHTAFGLNVLGAESEAGRVSGAEERQATLLAKHCQGVIIQCLHQNWNLNYEIVHEIQTYLNMYIWGTLWKTQKCMNQIYRDIIKNGLISPLRLFRNCDFIGECHHQCYFHHHHHYQHHHHHHYHHHHHHHHYLHNHLHTFALSGSIKKKG
ncbi:unnamed protein product [Meganyctiphanes norvegica]|uniref:Methyltransferase domain-containing protein n=1 Tax=Meganyctiphanes norvegica TaxID=48144 RepID=A0AAV2QZS9_MEGNR